MSIALNPNEKPAPPIRRTPSMSTNCHQQTINNGYIELQSRLKARLKRAEEIAGQADLINSHQKMTTVNKQMTATPTTKAAVAPQSNTTDDDFPPPPPEFLLSNDSKPPPPPTMTTKTTTSHSSLLAEIQCGFKLRKTMIDKDRSAPRLK